MRILVIEDEPDFVQALARGLRNQGYGVDIAMDGLEGLELSSINPYDLIILDLNLPLLDGLEVCRELRHEHPEVPILVLTARAEINDRVIGLDAGADDYLVKPFHFDELTARLRALLRRDFRCREPEIRIGEIILNPARRIAYKGENCLNLSNREFSILEYLIRHAGEVISQEELIAHVWGEGDIDELTGSVRVHIHTLRKKLGDRLDSPRYIETVIGQGYRFLSHDREETSGS